MSDPQQVVEILAPIVAARREQPQDDLISVLVEAEYTDEDGVDAPPVRRRDLLVRLLLLAAGSGTTWKQMGITLAAMLAASGGARTRCAPTARCCGRPSRSRCAGSRPTRCSRGWVTARHRVLRRRSSPQGSVVHLCLGAANRDPRAGTGPTSTTSPARRSRRSRSAAARTSASACTWPAPRWRSASTRCSTGCPNLRLDPDAEPPALHRHVRTRRHRDPGGVRLMTGNEPGYQAPDITLVGEEHIRRYRETDGEVGYLWNGVPTLLLTTTGRRSGEPRTSALIFARDGDDYLVVASMGGAPHAPRLVPQPHREPRRRDPGARASGSRSRRTPRRRRRSRASGRS